jgi:hypothetical protein
MKGLLFAVLFIFSNQLASQGITIIEHGNVRHIMQMYMQQNQEDVYIQGWRIQIITTNNRRKMENAKAKFRYKYPNINLSWEHKSPYYLVKVGAYQEKIDLQGFLLDLKSDFPGSIPIMDKIKKEELIAF